MGLMPVGSGDLFAFAFVGEVSGGSSPLCYRVPSFDVGIEGGTSLGPLSVGLVAG